MAKKLGTSNEIIKRNYQKLEKAAIIRGATIHINYRLFGYKAVAHILITMNPGQVVELIEFLKALPEIYAFYERGIKGKIDVIVILKTLENLNEIKDSIKSRFSISEMKTVIWTDVKEMNQNLVIIDEKRRKLQEGENKTSKLTSAKIDEIDQKIADKLAENGRISMKLLAKELGISTVAAKRKYERLKNIGALKVTIQIDPTKIGYQALCVYFIVTSSEKSPQIIEQIGKIPDIISIMKTAGDYDLQVYAMVQNLDQLLFIQEEIGKIQGITQIDSEILRLVMDKWPSPKQHISTF